MIIRLLRGAVAAIVLAGATVGIPVMLVLYGRSPLDGHGPILDQISSLPTQAISDQMAFGLLTIAAWAAWATFVHSVMIEAAAALGSAVSWRPIGPFQIPAHHLVTAITMTVSMSTSLPARAGSLPQLESAAPSEQVANTPHTATPAAAAPLTSSLRSAQVQATDGSFASSYGSAAASEHVTTIEPAPPNESAAPAITVAPGDSPWTLAEQHLGNGFRWRELWDLNRGVVQPDGRAWVTEDLIRPGWQLVVPTPSAETPPVADDAAAASEPDTQPAGPCNPGEQQTSTDGPVSPETSALPDTEPAPTTSTTEIVQDEQTSPTGRESSDGDEGDSEEMPDLVPPLVGVTGATVLATAMALLIRRMRRRSATRGAPRWRRRPAPDRDQVDAAIAAAADVPLVRWAGQELAQVMRSVDPAVLAETAPVAVELSEERGMEILWDQPAPAPPVPWASVDKGWAWSLPYDPDAPVPPDDWPSPIPALVTVGDREGRDLMFDLEAFGSVAVTGSPDRVADFGRAIALELGADEDLSDCYVSIVGLGFGLADHLRRVRTATVEEGLDHIRATSTAAAEVLDASEVSSTFQYRLSSDDHYLEGVVVVIDGSRQTAESVPNLREASPARRGVATILVGGTATHVSAHIHIDDQGMARIEPLGIEFRAAGLPASTEAELADLVRAEAEALTASPSLDRDEPLRERHHDHDDGEPVDGLPVLDLLPDPGDGPDADGSETPSQEHSLLVKVLGPPSVPDRPLLRRRELITTVYMACRNRPVTPSAIQNAVWGGRAIEPKTFWNVLARTRTTLAAFDDGTAIFPPTDRRSSTLQLAAGVVTDLALLTACYDQALQMPSSEAMRLLRRGLALVEGEPFDATGYEWAYRDDQYVADAATVIEEAAQLLVELATGAGDYDVAREAVAQGLRGLPGNEVLYRTRMRLEHNVGNMAGVDTAWNELNDFLIDLELEPSDATIALHTQLTRSN